MLVWPETVWAFVNVHCSLWWEMFIKTLRSLAESRINSVAVKLLNQDYQRNAFHLKE